MTGIRKNSWSNSHLIIGASFGYQVLTIIHLLPILLAELDNTFSPMLLIVASCAVLLLSQFEMGKRIAHLSAATAIRDSVYALCISFLVFLMAPHSFWLFLAFLAWLLSASAVQIAIGRWILLTGHVERESQLRLGIAGFCIGMTVAQATVRFTDDPDLDLLLYGGLGICGLTAFFIHLFSKANTGYTSAGQLWFWHELKDDRPLFGLIGLSFSVGMLLALPGFAETNGGFIIFGAGAFAFGAKKIWKHLGSEHGIRVSAYLTGGALLIDAIFNQSLMAGAVMIGFHAALVYSNIRLDAFRPKTLMTAGDRMAIHNTALVAGIFFQLMLHFFKPSPVELLVGNAAILAGAAYIFSFIPESSSQRL